MLKVTLKGVRSHLVRFLLTALAVTLGVSLVAGTYVLTDSIDSTFDELIDASSTGVDVSVRGAAGETSMLEGTSIRSPLPLTLTDELRQVDGVARVVPDLQGQGLLVGKDGTAVRNGGAPSFGFAFHDDDQALTIVDGRGPQNGREVAVERTTLEKSGLQVGDRTQALIGGRPRAVTITGEAKFDAGLAGATVILVDPRTAQQVYAPDGTVQSFSVTAAEGVGQDELKQRIEQVLPRNAEALTGRDVAAETREQIDEGLGFISTFMLVFAAVSLFVGGFIIANTFSMLVAQRTRELALLRAIGASRVQTLGVVLGEAAVIGVVGSAIGLVIGVMLARGLQALLGSFGLEVTGSLPVLPRTVIVSLLVGTLVTVVSAVLPAVRAARIAPVTAMRDDVAAPPGGVGRRGIIGALMFGAGAALVVPSVSQDSVPWKLVGLGAAIVVIGALVAAPAATRPIVRIVAAPFAATGTVGRMARENSLRNPRRTATTASALMIGLALMAGVSVIAASMRASVSDLVDRQLTADFVLNGGGAAQFPPQVSQAVEQLPGVASVAGIGAVSVTADKSRLYAIAGTAEGIGDNVKLEVQSGSLAALDQGEVVISESTADKRGWKVGSEVSAAVGALRDEPLRVGAVIADSQVLNDPGMILPRALYERAVPKAMQGDFLLYVKAAEGTDLAALRQTLVDLSKPFLVVSVQDGAEFTDSQANQINQLLYILYALLALSVLIAVLGIINTMALSVFERTREIGLLRAVGLSRAQLRRMITIESVSTAVFGALLGAALGLAFGVVIQRGLVSEGLEELAVPWVQITVGLVGAAVAGVIAAILPSMRAVRMNVLQAISAD